MSAKFGFQVTVNDRAIWVFPEDIDAAVATAKAQATKAVSKATETTKALAKTGITYKWTRSQGEDPISLGTLKNLVDFVDNSIVKPLGLTSFDANDVLTSVIGSLPAPIDNAFDSLSRGAVFELDEIRLRIPGKGGNESAKFEIAMLINLTELELELGPFRLNQLYAKLGNFDSKQLAKAG